MKRAIYPLYASADENTVKPILQALRDRNANVRDPRSKAGQGDALLLFLSKNMVADGPEADAFFRLNAGRELVIPVNLDGCTPPEDLNNALMARHGPVPAGRGCSAPGGRAHRLEPGGQAGPS